MVGAKKKKVENFVVQVRKFGDAINVLVIEKGLRIKTVRDLFKEILLAT